MEIIRYISFECLFEWVQYDLRGARSYGKYVA